MASNGHQALQVKITSEGTDWWGQEVEQDILTAYTHHDRLGSIVNLTDKYGRNIARADYREYGEIAFYESITVNGGYRRIAPQLVYTNHEWDDVLDLYYAKARFYSPSDKHFLSMDPIKGSITDPLSLTPYVYCVDNPLRWVDPLGLVPDIRPAISEAHYWGGDGTSKPQKPRPKTPDEIYEIEVNAPTVLTAEKIQEQARKDGIDVIMDTILLLAEQKANQDIFLAGFALGIVNALNAAFSGTFNMSLDTVNGILRSIFGSLIPESHFYEEYLESVQRTDETLANATENPAMFYLGLEVADVVMYITGLALEVAGAATTALGLTLATLPGAAAMLGGAVGGPVGAAVAATTDVVGAVVTVGAGVAITAEAVAITKMAADRLGHDDAKREEYQNKLACDEFQKKWDELLDKCTKRPKSEQPHSSTKIYDRDGAKGFEAAKRDFDALGLDNVTERPRNDGKTTYVGITPNGDAVNLHWSSYEHRWCIQYLVKNIKIRY